MGNGRLNGTLVTDCSAYNAGGFLCSTGGNVTLGNVTGMRLHSTGTGGGFAEIAVSAVQMIIDGCHIEGCTAVTRGGGIRYGGSVFFMTNTLIIDCKAGVGGGFESDGGCTKDAMSRCTAVISRCTFERCEATSDGGAFKISAGSKVIVKDGTRIVDCHAANFGGLAFVDLGNFEFKDSVGIRTTAFSYGFGIYGQNGAD
eukprot:5419923-Prymnesium_polylepis.1